MSDKLRALNTIALWVITIMIAGYLIFKPDNTLNKDTVDKLGVMVDKLGVASENMTNLTNTQRDWFKSLQEQATKGDLERNNNYNGLYGKYGYADDQNSGLSLNDLYDHKLRTQDNDIGSGNVRPVQDGNRKTEPVQKPAGEPQRQSH